MVLQCEHGDMDTAFESIDTWTTDAIWTSFAAWAWITYCPAQEWIGGAIPVCCQFDVGHGNGRWPSLSYSWLWNKLHCWERVALKQCHVSLSPKLYWFLFLCNASFQWWTKIRISKFIASNFTKIWIEARPLNCENALTANQIYCN